MRSADGRDFSRKSNFSLHSRALSSGIAPPRRERPCPPPIPHPDCRCADARDACALHRVVSAGHHRDPGRRAERAAACRRRTVAMHLGAGAGQQRVKPRARSGLLSRPECGTADHLRHAARYRFRHHRYLGHARADLGRPRRSDPQPMPWALNDPARIASRHARWSRNHSGTDCQWTNARASF